MFELFCIFIKLKMAEKRFEVMTGLPPLGQTACLLSENSGTGTNRKISAQQLLVEDGGRGGGEGGGDGNRHRGAVGQVVHQ